MSKKLPKEEQLYQLSKPYDFRDLEVSLIVKRDECERHKADIKRLQEENAGLRLDIKRYDKIFQESGLKLYEERKQILKDS